ncbi:telomeric repeat-binding factor 2-interacting protein 1 isoform X2 [Phyllopteryx taeniolatus]|nr:telomeric repeat-binding factor 2-interacting protein 1 isoform X2 [Phyllopteryx taeniolatus]XP_061639943.1 telomeric repeat-binding factor 2-interacting protein 1 isoform X2 [Phyllopteryx taeniolatus]XP_061639944.1 telomeric repeat-binding factor 2-interacting protein 1 isoform X2 [Phyllopteryx taeniolatus]
MASEGQDVTQCSISPVLFMTVEGEPLAFYLRPGPIKSKLQPLIKAGGGIMCNVQKPGAILLIDPEEKGTVSENTAHRYVSIQYIHDCVEKDEQLNLEDYRMKGGTVPMRSPKSGDGDVMSHANSGGRQAYSPDEDAAILNYVSRQKSEIKGNRLWQRMEKERVTTHSWQSMKAHYKSHLAQKQSEDVEEAEAVGEDAKNNDKAEVSDSPSCEDASLPQVDCEPGDPPQTNSADELTQIDLLLASEKGPLGDVQAQTSVPPQPEEKILNLPGDKIQQATTAEAEMCVCSRSEESTEPGPDQLQAKTSPQNEQTPESTDPTSSEPQSDGSTSNDVVQPVRVPRHSLRSSVHRRFEDSEEEPYTTKLRSSSSSSSAAASVRRLPSSPPTPRRTRSALSFLQEETREEEPPSKRAKGESSSATADEAPEEATAAIEEEAAVAGGEKEAAAEEEAAAAAAEEAAESQQEDVEQPPATPQAGPSHVNQPSESKPRQTQRKKKRKLGIIERATKEFLSTSSSSSSDSSSDSDSDSDSESESRVEVFRTPSETAVPESLASAEVCPAQPDTPSPEGEPVVWKTPPQRRLSPEPSSTVRVASKAQMDDESSKEDSVPPERVQLEEDKQRIRELMKQTNQDLKSVTKALLKASGDVSAASRLLSDPVSFCVPLWNRRDDSFLLSADPAAFRQLQGKYGEEGVAKRMVFLNVER